MNTTDKLAEQILCHLEKQKFYDWYTSGRFDTYIRGDLPKITKEEIIKDIKQLFTLTEH